MFTMPSFFEVLQCLGIMFFGGLLCMFYAGIYDFLYHRSK